MELITDIKQLKKPKELKQRINITIDPEMNNTLTKFAEDNELSKSDVIWLALANYFINWKKQHEEK